MVKIFGSLLVIFSLGMTGICKADKLRKRYEELLDFRKILVMLQGEIRYNNATISEAFAHVGRHFSGSYKKILDKASDKTAENSGNSLEEIWIHIVDEYKGDLNVKDNEIDIIKELGRSMGYLDCEMQENALNMLIEKIQVVIDEQGGKLPENVKVYRCMGIMLGIFVVLLIV